MTFFFPYVYFPSAKASYVKLVTSGGTLRIEKDHVFKVLITFVVLLASFLIYRWCFVNKNKSKKPTTSNQKSSTMHDTSNSALKDNYLRKGENSYYYAHQPREINDQRLELHKEAITTYGWTDKQKNVSIYLNDDIIQDIDEDRIHINWTKTSLKLDISLEEDGQNAKSLVISTLYHEITNVTHKVKGDRLTVTLHKAKELPWKSLNGAAKNIEEHIEYDESLYD